MGEFHEKKERKKYEMMFEVKVLVSRKYSVLITFNLHSGTPYKHKIML